MITLKPSRSGEPVVSPLTNLLRGAVDELLPNSMSKGVRKNISVPGLLASALKQRAEEFGHKTVSPYIVDLVCYDLKSAAPHSITLVISRDNQAAHDAVDAELVARYRPGQSRQGLLVQLVERLTELRSVARHADAPPPLSTQPERITIPAAIWRWVDLRWRELGYSSLSAYVTGLIRYDLLVGGPHAFKAADRPRMEERALAQEAQECLSQGQKRKLLLDHLIERAEQRPLSSADLDRIKADIARRLLRHLAAPRPVCQPKRARIGGRKARTLSSTRPRQRAD